MAKIRSEKSSWPSRYSVGGWVTVNQFIIEMICEKQAQKKNKDLPIKFWNLPEWNKEFVSQTRAVSRLLKKYDPKAIINSIKFNNIWSLRPKWVEQVIQREQKKLDAKKEKQKADDICLMPKDQKKHIVHAGETARRPQRPSKNFKLLAIDD